MTSAAGGHVDGVPVHTVSVVVINHNYADYVVEAVRSALDQTVPVEVIVVDDGSTDDSLARLASLGADFSVVRKPCGGQTSAINAGFAASSGDVVVFLDSDDRLLPHVMACALAAFAADPDIVKVHWPLRVVGRDGRPTGELVPTQLLAHGDLRSEMLAMGPESCAAPPQSGNAYARAFLETVMPLPELEPLIGRGSASADALLALLSAAAGNVWALYDPGGDYRLHGSNDYAGSGLVERARQQRRLEEAHFDIAERYWLDRGIRASSERWRATSWFYRLGAAFDAIEEHVPVGGTVILIDEDQWRPEIPGRRVIPFTERDGQYWGPPGSDRAAVDELERLRHAGATHVALAWHCAWWSESYPGLISRLAEGSRLVHRSPEVQIYDLTSGSGGRRPIVGGAHSRPSSAVPPVVADVGTALLASGVRELGLRSSVNQLITRLADRYLAELTALIPFGTRCALVDFPDHENVGDSAIWLGERIALERAGVRLVHTCSMADYDADELSAALGGGTILIHGGGNLGSLWPRHQTFREEVVSRFQANRIVQLPQTVTFRDRVAADRARAVFGAHPDLTVMVRDEPSRHLAVQLFDCAVVLAPDAAFCLGPVAPPRSPVVPIRWLARTDGEAARGSEGVAGVTPVDWLTAPASTGGDAAPWWGAVSDRPQRQNGFDEAARRRVTRGFHLLAEGRVVVTDRLHGHILSLLLRSPHVLLDDAFGKVRRFYEVWTSTSDITRFATDPVDAWVTAQHLLGVPPLPTSEE